MPSNQVTIIEFLGREYIASIYSFDEMIPAYGKTTNAIYIYCERAHLSINLIQADWILKLIPKLHTTGNKLMLSGVEDNVLEQTISITIIELIGEDNTLPEKRHWVPQLWRRCKLLSDRSLKQGFPITGGSSVTPIALGDEV